MNFSKFWTFLIIATFFYVACAQKRLPPGGPTDVTPPSILELFPDTINTNIQKLLTIRIKFDEMVNQGSFQSALRVIPPNYEYEVSWLDFDEVEMIPANPDSQLTETVIVFIGRELSDLRRNGLKMSIDLIFTPYDSIPSGQISGKIYGIENKKELQVWAVTFNDSTANPPLRIADIEDENQYILKYLKDPHLYLPVIIEDRGKKYTIEKDDKLFLPYKNSAHMEYNFWQPVSKDSFIMPGISKFLLVKQNVLSWQIERPDPNITFRFLVNNEYTEPLFIYQDPQRPATYFAWWDSLGAEELEIVWYRDSLQSADRQLVDLSEEMESVIFSMKTQGINEPLLPNDTLTFISSIPFEPNDIDQLYFSGNIEGKVNFTSPVRFEVFPIDKWPLNEIISIEFKYHPLDTILHFNFETIHPRDMGKISGIINYNGISDSIRIYITARDINRQKEFSIISENTHFSFDQVRDGYYSIRAWVDENNNCTYDVGRLFPFESPEPFWFSPDTLKVRKRWENRSTVIIF